MRLFALPALLIASVGCRGHAIHVVADGNMVASGAVSTFTPADHTAYPVEPRALGSDGDCCFGRVALLDVDGLLLNRNMTGVGSMGENPVAFFQEKLKAAASDPAVRAVVLRINSPGGGVTASDIMRREVEMFKRQTSVPVVAIFMDVGAGGGYYLATAADVVVAHPTTITGGIGVIFNAYSLQDTMAQFNVLGMPIKAGENIDLGSPIKGLTPESRQLLQGVADEFQSRFRNTVVTARGLSNPPTEIFDGRIFTAKEALRHRLIDQIGYLDDAVTIARELAGLPAAAELVVYRRNNDRALSTYDITPNLPLQNGFMPASVPGLDRGQLPAFLYLWQPEPLLERTGGS